MAQLFKPNINYFARLSLMIGLVAAGAGLGFVLYFPRSPFVTQEGVIKEQPVPFSHLHHVSDVGLDCRYCHTSVETSKNAGLPPTSTCLTCHSQLFRDSPVLEPVRESGKTGRPIEWVRVHDLPDFVYFDHSVHVNKGVGCVSCHGRVDQMPLVVQVQPLTMLWCLECHKNPWPNIRPKEAVFNTAWQDTRTKEEKAKALSELRQSSTIQSLKDCSVCHR